MSIIKKTSTFRVKKVYTDAEISNPSIVSLQTEISNTKVTSQNTNGEGLGRLLDTVYQNTSDKNRFITVTGDSTGTGAYITAYSDSTSDPTIIVGVSTPQSSSGDTTCITFIVPNNYYYKVTMNIGSILYWTEWE